ncbi:MAG TPA: ABC transporter permease, partial [Chthoniobacterales bacterium]
IFYPVAYLMVFGVAMDRAMGFTVPGIAVDYNAFFLAGVLGMASFAIASNTAWSFFMDRDNGIFYEMLTYPMSRGQYLFGKVLFNIVVALVQALITIVLGAVFLDIPLHASGMPLLLAGIVVGTAGWFFFYAIFALRIRRNDAFNTVTSVFYFIFLFASSMFYPLDPLPLLFRVAGYANPITWQVDILRYATIGLGNASIIAMECAAFVVFSAICFVIALRALHHQE